MATVRRRGHSSAAIDHLSEGYEGLIQLRALMLSSNCPAKTSTTAPAFRLLDKALHCVTAVLAELQISSPGRLASSVEDNKDSTNTCKRRKIHQQWTVVTSVPHFDGNQWRKYGEKHIHKSMFPRSYYKCTYNKDRGCPATKTIQQKEDEHCNPPKYEVIYSMQHICKNMETSTPFVKEDFFTIINNASNKTASSTFSSNELTASSCQATSPQPLPMLVAEQTCPMESMLISTELQGEENGIESSRTIWPPNDSDFEWEWLMN